MIVAEHLTKKYGNFTAVSDLSFTIGDGEIVYVDPSATLRKGDVGIFAVDGAVYCKIYYVDNDGNLTLVSANPELQEANIYVDQSSGQEVHTFGKVLGHSEVRIPDTFPG